jgi:hypothetical protein
MMNDIVILCLNSNSTICLVDAGVLLRGLLFFNNRPEYSLSKWLLEVRTLKMKFATLFRVLEGLVKFQERLFQLWRPGRWFFKLADFGYDGIGGGRIIGKTRSSRGSVLIITGLEFESKNTGK